jgi:general L-amino acid transport system permease protein
VSHVVRPSPIAARPPPLAQVSTWTRWRRVWWPTPALGALSLALAVALAVFLVRGFEWAVLRAHWHGSSSADCPSDGGACWAFIVARWKPWLVGDYPADQLWRAWACFVVFAVFWAWLVRRVHDAPLRGALTGFLLLPIAFLALLAGGGPLPSVSPSRWGGLLLTLVVSLSTFAGALPLGLALALGRRSRLPVVRALSTAFVEGLRAVPLLAVLFIAATLLPLFLPSSWNIGLFARAVIAFVLFNAALAAEVFRGGLQTVGRGQLEAAATVGLSDLAALRLVVLPQAVRAVVPALVNIMIAVIKETTLLSVIGLGDLLGAVETGAKSPEWVGDANILSSGHVFLAAAYLSISLGLSRYSRRLEAAR